MEGDRVRQQLLGAPLVVLGRVLEVRLEVDLPVALRLHVAVAHAQEMAGEKLLNALEEGLAGERELEGQVIGEPVRVGLDLRQERQQRLHLGREVEDAVNDRVVERLDPEAVPRGEQRLSLLVPEREREHPAQPLEAGLAPLAVGAQDHLGVGARVEAVLAEEPAQLDVVVDLAVVGDPVAGAVGHRLVT